MLVTFNTISECGKNITPLHKIIIWAKEFIAAPGFVWDKLLVVK